MLERKKLIVFNVTNHYYGHIMGIMKKL